MMKVNGHWENVETLLDISRVIREHYNSELADKMDEIIGRIDNSDDYIRERMTELEIAIEEIQNLVRYL